MEENDPNNLAFPEDREKMINEEQYDESPPSVMEEGGEESTSPPENEPEAPPVEAKSYSRSEARERAQRSEPVKTTGEKSGKAALCYLGGWITGLLIFMTEKENAFVRFHAIQSLLWSVSALFIWLVLAAVYFIGGIALSNIGATGFLPLLLGILFFAWGVINFIYYFVLMFKAFSGEWYKLPMLGDKAEELS